jgi:AcrR family transcriptional regulator
MNVQNERVGRPAAVTREQALERAGEWLQAGRRVEMRALARDLGVGRTTLYDWFGSREGLVSEAFAAAARRTLSRIRSQVTTTGAAAILETLRRYDRAVATHPAIIGFLRADPATTIRLVTDPSGALHRTHVAMFEELIGREVQAGAYVAPLPVATLAHALVTLGEHTIFIEAQRFQPDLERLATVQAHLLEPRGSGEPSPSGSRRPCARTT